MKIGAFIGIMMEVVSGRSLLNHSGNPLFYQFQVHGQGGQGQQSHHGHALSKRAIGHEARVRHRFCTQYKKGECDLALFEHYYHHYLVKSINTASSTSKSKSGWINTIYN